MGNVSKIIEEKMNHEEH